MDGKFTGFDGFESDGNFVNIDFGFAAFSALEGGKFFAVGTDGDLIVSAVEPKFYKRNVNGADKLESYIRRLIVFPGDSPLGEGLLPVDFLTLNNIAGECLLAVEEILSLIRNIIRSVFVGKGKTDFFVGTVNGDIALPAAGVSGQTDHIFGEMLVGGSGGEGKTPDIVTGFAAEFLLKGGEFCGSLGVGVNLFIKNNI